MLLVACVKLTALKERRLSSTVKVFRVFKQDDNYQFTRIERVLEFIHQNLEMPLSVELLAEKSCWSRWQLQRVFSNETGLSVANYVREVKLSKAAENLVNSEGRIVDIALKFGFNSEVSFNRAFKQMFGCTPGQYKRRGQLVGLRSPIYSVKYATPTEPKFIHIHVETLRSISLAGQRGEINGLFSSQPNFSSVVPKIWEEFHSSRPELVSQAKRFIGVIDVGHANDDGTGIPYWAMVETSDSPDVTIPSQLYAIIKHKGPISDLANTIEWFIYVWLPESNFVGIDGYELEVYPTDFDCQSLVAEMEYWLPIKRR